MNSHFVKVELSFPRHRKTLRLRRLIGDDAGRWVPVSLWLYCIESAEDGDLSKLSARDLADVLDYHGDAKKLRDALIKAGFMDSKSRVAGWEERYTRMFEFYRERAVKASNARWGKTDPADPPSRPSPAERPREEESEISKHSTSMLEGSPTHTWASPIPEEVTGRIADALHLSPAVVRKQWDTYRKRQLGHQAPVPSSQDDMWDGFEGWADVHRPRRAATRAAPALPEIREPQDWSRKVEGHEELGRLAGRVWVGLIRYDQEQIKKFCEEHSDA